MNTTAQRDRSDASKPSSGHRAVHADTLDILLLILTIVVLAGTAVAIVIEFPQALEIIAVDANAAGDLAPQARTPQQGESADENQETNEPFFADDIRAAGAVYAAADNRAAAARLPLDEAAASS